MTDYRGRRRGSHNHEDYYYEGHEPPKRNRSLSRKVLDKIEDKIYGPSDSSKALVHHEHYRRPASPRRHSRDSDWETDYIRREYRSVSPVRHYSQHSHHSHHSHHRGRRDSDRHGGSSERSRSRWDRSIAAAVDAAAIEAFRVRKEPGRWTGAKGERVATAAFSAAVLGAATDNRKEQESNKKGAFGSAIGGLVINRLVNGPRRELR
ncbi:hypothetical protein B0T25DRAFT_232771 [Lasiosphaeria hispida]|uniref:DUF3824 domain-containing protein n=1 Tax=Lasiosphaeria hispida TaxID=260671 RepID=A0AAJ0HDT7_9PEZI|nr:hypothetical protein B0T25DRAFT_232771 [Lasiosphaeria hispida]